ncbi:MAG: hypothetical protein Q8L10_04185 [Candidatus Moranbacteria bacterium]|nr:hypothetical protein [Candidatus Moranbacteria bacterium]
MKTEQSDLFDLKTPLVFMDGTGLYKKFAKEYITHKKGFFIMAPSGAGKTHFISSQKEKHWIDGDDLWKAANAHPKDGWWLEAESVMDRIDQRCDVITVEAKKLGFWVMGASNFWLKPDAIVIPDWNTHKKYIKHREINNYDGGATSDRLEQVKNHRKWIMQWAKKGVPRFKSVEDAVNYLTKNSKN